ncbi:polysaccharide deacetylase family protein [Anaerosphaera multitolerans]|uniref:Polysaccharide deacetylase family protein n=1 Tax=Anaerosphaera multitolerans TaxID=2487351 RepID=A0A437S9F0_9FIRM|nr:polysaccharide deacetylase family protein [Anaerosphaera multitolerans]RVU55756.1 polysaccharide deacetylase family protein [Anaerosphaera multitolerans]
MKKKIILLSLVVLLLLITIYNYKFKTVGDNTIPVITYHSIRDENPTNNEYIISCNNFEHMVKSLKESGFHFLSTEEIANAVDNNTKLPDNSVLITFDDGYEDNYTNVLPILEKYDAKATVFLIGSYIGEKSGYLNWEQVQKMSESGHFNIESHTYNLHDLFLDGPNKGKTWLSEKLEEESDEEYFEKVKNDLIWNNNLIYEHTSVFPNAIAYPGAMVNDIVLDAVRESGLKIGFIGGNKRASSFKNLNPYKIKRFHIKPSTNIENKIRFLKNGQS